jgi:transposase
MSLPKWLEKYKQPKTEIRYLNGTYYQYAVSYKYSPELKRTKKITGVLLGKITREDGFIRSKKDSLRDIPPGKITVAEYGAGNLFLSHMKEELNYLSSSFQNSGIDWRQIAAAAMIRWIYHSPIKMMEYHWRESYYYTDWKVSLSDKQVSQLLRQLGENRGRILDYFSHFPVKGEYLLIDTTNIPSKSVRIEDVQIGYNRQYTFSPQSNLFFIFSAKLQMPVYYRVVPGNIRDVKSFAFSLLESGISDAVIVADKGFHSRENIRLLKEESLQYVIPLRRSNSLISYGPMERGSKKEMADYFEYAGRFIWFYETYSEGDRVITFFDERLKVEEEHDYMRRIATRPEEYTRETFFQKQYQFGTLSCITNLNDPAEKIYNTYKCRGQIEQVFDTYKNFLEADRTYMQNEKALHGWSFINFIAIQAYYKLFTHLKDKPLLKHHSVADLIHFALKNRKLRLGDNWVDAEVTKKHLSIWECK